MFRTLHVCLHVSMNAFVFFKILGCHNLFLFMSFHQCSYVFMVILNFHNCSEFRTVPSMASSDQVCSKLCLFSISFLKKIKLPLTSSLNTRKQFSERIKRDQFRAFLPLIGSISSSFRKRHKNPNSLMRSLPSKVLLHRQS